MSPHSRDIDCFLTEKRESSADSTFAVSSADLLGRATPSTRMGANYALNAEKGCVSDMRGHASLNQVDSPTPVIDRAAHMSSANSSFLAQVRGTGFSPPIRLGMLCRMPVGGRKAYDCGHGL